MEMKGKVLKVLPTVTGMGKKGKWHKQQFIIEVMNGTHPTKLCVELWGEEHITKAELIPDLAITMKFDMESREHNDRWYTSIRAFGITWESQAVRRWTPGGR